MGAVSNPTRFEGLLSTLMGVGTGVSGYAGEHLRNLTPAASGFQQSSPPEVFEGRGYATSGATSMPVQVAWQLRPVQGSTEPTMQFDLMVSINGSAFAPLFRFSNSSIASMRGLTNPWNLTAQDGGNALNLYNSIFTITGAGCRPEAAGSTIWGGSGWAWKEVMARLFTSEPLTSLTVSSNTIAVTRMAHKVTGGGNTLKTITAPSEATNGADIWSWLIPVDAFTYDNTGNILVASGSGTAVIDRPMLAMYSYAESKWRMSY